METRGGSLQGRTAIVTGAGSGMGAATARLFAAEGANVVVAGDIDEAGGTAVVEEIGAAGGTAIFHRVDVSSSAEVEGLVKAAVDAFGRLDCAVNNAAVAPDTRPLPRGARRTALRPLIAVDLKGVALCLQARAEAGFSSPRGGAAQGCVEYLLVNGCSPPPKSGAYTAAKHGVIGLTKVASAENAPRGSASTSSAPARSTHLCCGARSGDAMRDAEAFASTLSLLGRFGDPAEVAEASLWLCSDRSSYVTGVTLPVDAGYLAR